MGRPGLSSPRRVPSDGCLNARVHAAHRLGPVVWHPPLSQFPGPDSQWSTRILVVIPLCPRRKCPQGQTYGDRLPVEQDKQPVWALDCHMISEYSRGPCKDSYLPSDHVSNVKKFSLMDLDLENFRLHISSPLLVRNTGEAAVTTSVGESLLQGLVLL